MIETGDHTEVIRSQQAVIAEQAKLIETLTRKLSARGIAYVPMQPEWTAELTRGQSMLMELLKDAYPRILTRDFLLDHLPGREERYDRAVDALVKHCRKKLGKKCVQVSYGLGYRMGDEFYKSITSNPLGLPLS